MNMQIRPMLEQDRSMVVDILSRTVEFTAEEVAVATELIDIYLKDGERSGYSNVVADDGSSICGYICYGPTPMTAGTWDVYWIAVDPEKKGRGTGKRLLNHAEEKIGMSRGRLILIETSSKPSYENTRQFYLGTGYVVEACIGGFYAPDDDKVIFRKSISTHTGETQ